MGLFGLETKAEKQERIFKDDLEQAAKIRDAKERGIEPNPFRSHYRDDERSESERAEAIERLV